MFVYLKNLVLTTMLFLMYLLNYIMLSKLEKWMYLANVFDYNYSLFAIVIAYVTSVPFIAYIISTNRKKVFSALVTLLLLVGVLPGVIVYSLSSLESKYIFVILYVYILFILNFFSIKSVYIKKETMQYESKININLFLYFGYFGIAFYSYLLIKYFNIINLRSISDVYIQRSIFFSVVSGWEIYCITFAKYISAFSLLTVAIYKRKSVYLLPIIFVYSVDYLLAAHKTSIVLMLFAVFYYFYNKKINIQNFYINNIVFIVLLFTITLQYMMYTENILLDTVIGLYDRIFFVTSSLFARFYEFANLNYFFYGGSGLIGKLFSSISINDSYTLVVGSTYFSENVRANADFISDGYINFGIIGSLVEIIFLWLFFNKRDNKIYREQIVLLFPLTFVYSIVLFSMGLQTSLLTGGMIFYIIIIKFGFSYRKNKLKKGI